MGYRSDVQLAVYTKTKENFITAFTRWRLDNGVDFTEWTMWTNTEIIDSGKHELFGFIFTDESVKWYGGYPEVDEVERVMHKLPDYGFCVEFLRTGEESGDIETFEQAPEGEHYYGMFWVESVIVRTNGLQHTYEHRLGDKSWIADYVENQSTIGDQRSDTQPA